MAGGWCGCWSGLRLEGVVYIRVGIYGGNRASRVTCKGWSLYTQGELETFDILWLLDGRWGALGQKAVSPSVR